MTAIATLPNRDTYHVYHTGVAVGGPNNISKHKVLVRCRGNWYHKGRPVGSELNKVLNQVYPKACK